MCDACSVDLVKYGSGGGVSNIQVIKKDEVTGAGVWKEGEGNELMVDVLRLLRQTRMREEEGVRNGGCIEKISHTLGCNCHGG